MKTLKKYYIPIGMYDSTSTIIYYKNHSDYSVRDFKLRVMINFDEKHLQDDDIFNEQEIKELKATLPESMAKIIDLGKTEVEYE